jgi:hypothetical protein
VTDLPDDPVTHTRGPWETHVDWDARGYPCFYIHGFSGDQKRDEPVLHANARLIAAAPDLLAALDALAEFVFLNELTTPGTIGVLYDAQSALEKARGVVA